VEEFLVIKNLVLWAGTIIAFVYLTGDQFRFSRQITVIRMSALSVLVVINGSMLGHYFILNLLSGAVISLMCIAFTKGNLVANLTLIGLYMDIMNFLAVLFIGLIYGVYASVTGQGQWMVTSEAGVLGEILILIGGFVMIPVSIWIVGRLKPAVRGLTGWRRVVVFLLCEGLRLINNIIKSVGGGLTEYQNDPHGIYMLLDTLLMAGALVGIGLILLQSFRQQRAERRDMERQMEEALQEYNEITVLRQEIRELNHDMRNLRQTPAQRV
jgi:hypothetical protein